MKKITLALLASVLILSGAALAQQSGEQKRVSPMRGMMQEMMKGERDGQSGMGGRSDMGGMMDMMGMMGQMTKMMDQCAAMMGSAGTETQKDK